MAAKKRRRKYTRDPARKQELGKLVAKMYAQDPAVSLSDISRVFGKGAGSASKTTEWKEAMRDRGQRILKVARANPEWSHMQVAAELRLPEGAVRKSPWWQNRTSPSASTTTRVTWRAEGNGTLESAVKRLRDAEAEVAAAKAEIAKIAAGL
jgi:hypothetical protein